MHLTFMPITEETLPLAGKLHCTVWHETYDAFSAPEYSSTITPEFHADLHRQERARGGFDLYILYVGEEPAGILNLDVENGEVQHIFILKRFSGQGYGKQAMDFAFRQLAEKGHSAAKLWVIDKNSNAVAFYKHLGFVPTGEKELLDGSDGLWVSSYAYPLIQ